jgi:hypothetical protein
VAVGIVLTAVRSSVALGLAALGAAFLTGMSAASSGTYLRSAAASRGHVVAVFTFGTDNDMTPGSIAVAAKSAIQADGSFVSTNVRVQEKMSTVTRVTSGYRFRTQHKLRPGRYYVKVSGVVVGLDCTPHKPCNELWSNARRVVIPRP